MKLEEAKELEIHLCEYKRLSDELQYNIQRIDRIRGIYFAALAGLIGLLIQPGIGSLADHLKRIEADPILTSLVLIVPVLNSVLLVHVSSFIHFIYAAARYMSSHLGWRMAVILNTPVLQWENWESMTGDKQAWKVTRNIVGVFNFVLANGLSVILLFRFADAGRLNKGVLAAGSFAMGVLAVSLCIVVAIVNYRSSERLGKEDLSAKNFQLTHWYLSAFPLAGALYGFLIWLG